MPAGGGNELRAPRVGEGLPVDQFGKPNEFVALVDQVDQFRAKQVMVSSRLRRLRTHRQHQCGLQGTDIDWASILQSKPSATALIARTHAGSRVVQGGLIKHNSPLSPSVPKMTTDRTVRFVAYLEAAKGIVVLAAATGLLSLIHQDVYQIAALLIEHAHLDPASKYPQIFLDAASKVEDPRLIMLAAGAALYSLVRLVEAYGLYFERAWAEILAALSGAIYVPFELLGLVRKPTWHGLALLLLNLVVVALMVRAVLRRRHRAAIAAA